MSRQPCPAPAVIPVFADDGRPRRVTVLNLRTGRRHLLDLPADPPPREWGEADENSQPTFGPPEAIAGLLALRHTGLVRKHCLIAFGPGRLDYEPQKGVYTWEER